jgi:hypothetical protein
MPLARRALTVRADAPKPQFCGGGQAYNREQEAA